MTAANAVCFLGGGSYDHFIPSVVDAITSAGWVPGARLVFQAKRRTGDYHGQMNFDNFRKWFSDLLLPRIPAGSLLVMDNAPYHNVYVEGAFYPTTATRKEAPHS